MKRHEICIPRILAHEGGYVNHPSDPGGATNLGITIGTFRAYINPRGTVADLKALTVKQATIVYKAQYWDAVSADKLPIGVDYAVADFAVNSGPARAVRYLQGVVGVKQDGKVGPKTLAAVASGRPADIVNALCDRRMTFLRGLTTFKDFGKGWTNRVAGVRADALADIAKPAYQYPASGAGNTGAPVKPGMGAVGIIGLILAALVALLQLR